VIVAVLAVSSAWAGTIWYDTFGFEPGVDPTLMTPDFTPTWLAGQGNWPQATGAWTGAGGGGGIAPIVVPDPLRPGQCVELNIGDTQGDNSVMDIGINDPLAAGYRKVTVSYDILRVSGPLQNLWWWWWDAGTPTYGLQWDNRTTLPFGWMGGAGSAPTVVGQWANLTQTWDFTTNTVSSWYNGAPVDVAIPMPVPPDITKLTGWTIQFGHDSGTGTGSDVAWIDNFSITVDNRIPEPSMFVLAGLGLLTLLRKKK
jgi:hypothetical protein